jgi:YD repeat-containing protein
MIKKIAFAAIVVLLMSCQKDSSGDTNETGKITAITQNGNTLSYTYDNDGRLISRTAPEGNATYTYTPGMVTEKIITPTGLVTLIYELNAQGLVSKSYNLDSSQFFTTYQYNAAGMPVIEKYQGAGNSTIETTYYYAPSGNPDSAISKKFNNIIQKNIFEFDPILPNTLLAEKFGIYIFGKDATNLITKQTEITTGGNTIINTYAYEFDNTGRATKIIRRQPGTSLEETTNYNY